MITIREISIVVLLIGLLYAYIGRKEDRANYVHDGAEYREFLSIRRTLQLILLALIILIGTAGCTKVVRPNPEDVLRGADGQPVAIVTGPVMPEPGVGPNGALYLPDVDPVAIAAEQQHFAAERTHYVPMWGCTAFDAGTTVFALAHGFVEANPLGLLVIPFSVAVNFAAQHRAAQGDATPAKIQAAAHCGAGALNVATLAGAL